MRIELSLRDQIDLKFLSKGILVQFVRIMANVRFRTPLGWTRCYPAIVDTGATVSVIPPGVWRDIEYRVLDNEPIKIHGYGSKADEGVFALMAQVIISVFDQKGSSGALKIKAYLAESEDDPLILGFTDFLTQHRLVCDYARSEAYLEIKS